MQIRIASDGVISEKVKNPERKRKRGVNRIAKNSSLGKENSLSFVQQA